MALRVSKGRGCTSWGYCRLDGDVNDGAVREDWDVTVRVSEKGRGRRREGCGYFDFAEVSSKKQTL